MLVRECLTKFTQLSCYAPNDVNTDEKKKYCFLEGLNTSLQYALSANEDPVSRSWSIELSSWRRSARIWEKNASTVCKVSFLAATSVLASTLLPQVQCSAMKGRISNRGHHRRCLIRLQDCTSRQCSSNSSSLTSTFSSSNPTTTSPSNRIALVKDRATSTHVLVVVTSGT